MMFVVFNIINSTDYNIGSEEHNNNIIGPNATKSSVFSKITSKSVNDILNSMFKNYFKLLSITKKITENFNLLLNTFYLLSLLLLQHIIFYRVLYKPK